MFEKRFIAVPPQSFTSNGDSDGKLTIANTRLFKVKQKVTIIANTLTPLELEIKRILDANTVLVGPTNSNINDRTDISAYTTALSAAIFANEQDRPNIPEQSVERFTYEEEPTVARRVMLVDKLGDYYRTDNPLPVQLSDGSINIGTVEANLEVQLTAKDDDPTPGEIHDSIRIGDGTNELKVNADGSINVVTGGSSAANPTIVNIPVPTANVEVSYPIPTGSTKIRIRVRDDLAKMRLAFVSGDTASNYITVNMGSYYSVDSIITNAGFTLYFQLNRPGKTVEILTWS